MKLPTPSFQFSQWVIALGLLAIMAISIFLLNMPGGATPVIIPIVGTEPPAPPSPQIEATLVYFDSHLLSLNGDGLDAEGLVATAASASVAETTTTSLPSLDVSTDNPWQKFLLGFALIIVMGTGLIKSLHPTRN